MKNLAPNLLNIVDAIESKRGVIASEWIKIATVKTIFKSYNISPKKFQDGFGIPIIEYFIAVVREEKEVGDCPIMTKLVLFLLEKNITPQDVFDICMGLRKTLVAFLFKENLVGENPLNMMDEIANLFDANLSGVLKIFTTYYQKQKESLNQSITYQKKLKQITKIINSVNTKIIIIQNNFIIMGNQSFFETVGVKSIKNFYEKYKTTFGFIKDVDYLEKHYDSSNIDTILEELNDKNESFQATIHNYKHSQEFVYSGRVTTLPESDPTQYIITLNNIHSYMEDKTEIRKLMSRDQLTGLNNYTTFEYLLSEAQEKAQKEDTKLALAMVYIHDLRTINHDKGLRYGDKVIVDVAESIKSFASDSMILSHFEGSKFGILIPYTSEQECYDWCCSLYMTLNAKNEHIFVCLTPFERLDNIDDLQLRAYSLCNITSASDDDIVQTDFKNITPFVNLPEQKRFTDKLKFVEKINTSMYYKELPVSVSNTVLHVDQDSVTVRLSAKQFLIASDREEIYLELPPLGFVKAYIKHIDNVNMTMTIHKFGMGKYFPMQRKKFRVQAERNMHISIVYESSVIEGIVLNLNEEAIALMIDEKKELFEGALVSVQMRFEIENKIEHFHTSATIQKIQKMKEGYKVVLVCHLNNCNKTLLSKYIAKRQIEIINEMRSKSLCNNI